MRAPGAGRGRPQRKLKLMRRCRLIGKQFGLNLESPVMQAALKFVAEVGSRRYHQNERACTSGLSI